MKSLLVVDVTAADVAIILATVIVGNFLSIWFVRARDHRTRRRQAESFFAGIYGKLEDDSAFNEIIKRMRDDFGENNDGSPRG